MYILGTYHYTHKERKNEPWKEEAATGGKEGGTLFHRKSLSEEATTEMGAKEAGVKEGRQRRGRVRKVQKRMLRIKLEWKRGEGGGKK